MFLEDLTGLVLWALFTVIVINVVFLIFVFFRRVRRKRYYKDKDAARIRFQPVVAELAANYITVEEAAEFLREAHSSVEKDAVQELLFSAMTAENESRISKLFFVLGYVERWSKQAYGRGRAAKVVDAAMQHEQPTTLPPEKSPLDGYRRMRVSSVPRAVAIYNLGRLAPEYSTLFAAEALRDPATDVRRSAIAALGRNRNVAAIPLLVEELRKSIEENSDVSIRSTKAALSFYALADLRQFVPYLTHPNRRLRFFIVDIVRDITNKAARNTTLSKSDFAPQLYEIYLQKVVNDDFADVRARSVAVIRHFHDQRAAQALRALLSDENEFVRLHAVRAAADPHYADLIPQIVPLMADRKWRVREATVRTLGSFGAAGTSQVYRYFLQSKDNYASEQIADEIQRVGFMTHVTDFHVGGGEDAGLVKNVFQKMAGMKKTSLMNNMVASGSAPELRMMLMDALATAPTAELPGVLEAIAKSDTGEVGAKAGTLLRKIQTPGERLMLHNITVLRFIDYCNTVILLYFIFTNLMYTLLMVLSLYSVSLYSKFASHQSYEEIADSPATPPVSLIVPAYNESQSIVQTVLALMSLNYPEKEIIVVDDGSTDDTINVLVREFGLLRMDFIYREAIPAKPPLAYYFNPDRPELIVMYKENGGKSDALNVGINMVHSPYFCTVDADSIIEADALLRLMAPVLQSSTNTVASGGVVRIANGCTLSNGRITKIDLPKKWLERCQVVEYIRTFLFGRPGWNLLNATFIASGALMVLHTESVTLAGGYSSNTVTEDIEMIATLHRFLRGKGWKYRMVFTTEPICWTEAPHTVRMLARQRRRWQLGLMQTVMKHNDMIINPTYGPVGMLSMPFHAYMEAMGCLIEAAGTILVPVSFIIGIMPIWLFLLILFLAIGYGTLLSVGSVLLEETTIRRYPRMRHTLILMFYAVIENFGYKQMVTFFRAHAILQYFFGKRTWEHVVHRGLETRVVVEDYET